MRFGLFRPTCPIDVDTQQWVRERMDWLIEQFGIQTLRSARAIEPTHEFFPDPFDRSEAAVQKMLQRVCDYMAVDAERIVLQLYTDACPSITGRRTGAAGLYSRGEKEIVAVAASNLADPQALVATLAHELAHVRLLGEDHLTGDEEDHEPLTDLATVFFGLGIFNANSRFRFSQWTRGNRQGWAAASLGYLDEPTFGYALALWATLRGESRPKWVRHLSLNPRSYTRQSLRFLGQHPPSPPPTPPTTHL